jgi:hypothetical protein
VPEQADAVVAGVGPGGKDVAGRLAEGALSVVGVEFALIGSECPYWGRVPSRSEISVEPVQRSRRGGRSDDSSFGGGTRRLPAERSGSVNPSGPNTPADRLGHDPDRQNPQTLVVGSPRPSGRAGPSAGARIATGWGLDPWPASWWGVATVALLWPPLWGAVNHWRDLLSGAPESGTAGAAEKS